MFDGRFVRPDVFVPQVMDWHSCLGGNLAAGGRQHKTAVEWADQRRRHPEPVKAHITAYTSVPPRDPHDPPVVPEPSWNRVSPLRHGYGLTPQKGRAGGAGA